MTYEYDVPNHLDSYNDIAEIYKYLRKKIKKDYNGAEKQYLLQIADWKQLYGDPKETTWIALSPISGYIYSYWPLYSLDIKISDETKVTFKSWKGHYEDTHLKFLYGGTLKKDHENDCFQGDIWTRGK